MNGGCGTRALWRWRGNPLRRTEDVLEAWVVLAVWVVVAVGGTLVGVLAGHAADEAFARQRAERHAVRAVLVTGSSPIPAGDSAVDDRAAARVRWTAPDGTAHTGSALVDTGLKAGSRVVVWVDDRGALTGEPPDRTAATVEAVLFGGAAALGLAAPVVGAGALLRWRLDRRRIDAWGREWDLVEPGWGHRTG
ncbi:Rv1733c family protein [Streptomyces griseosporeus]|uniref:Rv1733c family protein n=1 Tax=Streptomyces griseosporeus TaxID=1910 RepID=UPI0036A45C9D